MAPVAAASDAAPAKTKSADSTFAGVATAPAVDHTETASSTS